MKDIDGIIVINKSKNYTSHDIVAKVRKILNIKKVGHTGTLDPNATGVLSLLIGNGTKLSKYLINHDKEYEVVLKLGIKTNTADGEGNIIEERNIDKNILNKENVQKIIKKFIGEQLQVPPMYSAIKIKGKKLYEYARSGQKIELEPRKIKIYKIDIIDINSKENEISFKVQCSKGTYIRSLCEDIANSLGTVGYMKELNRTKVGIFNIENAITIQELEENLNEEFIKDKLITMEKLFKDKEKINLNNNQLKHFMNGVKITVSKENGIYNIYNENKYIGIGSVEDKLLKRDIIK